MAINTGDNLTTLSEIARVLEDSGYEVAKGGASLAVKIPYAGNAPALASLTIDEIRAKLIISSRVARYGDVAQDRLPAFQAALLDANTRIDPFAFATLTDRDDPNLESPDEWIVVLIESLPIGDLSANELRVAMADLAKALPTSGEILAAVA